MKRAEEGGPFGGDEGRRNNLFSRGATGQTNTVDVLNALASVARYPDADPDRIGMWGHSMGGTITLRAMVVTDTIWAGVIWAGVVAPYPDLVD
jgi:dienelactone hydrolase